MTTITSVLASAWFLGSLSLSVRAGELLSAVSDDKSEFIDVQQVNSKILIDIRYASDHNFVGGPIDGYRAPKCLLTKVAADKLSAVQKEAEKLSLSLKVYDCYRPFRAVKHFVLWAHDATQTMKGEFYPQFDKRDAFRLGYISDRSGHCRGSTIDLTLVPIPTPKQPAYKRGDPLSPCNGPTQSRFKDNSIDMGTGYDCFDPLSQTIQPKVSKVAQSNRLLLKKLMEKQGFKNYEGEWWHYSLIEEPFPSTYFDFAIQ